jgi:hypothetical protein
MKRSSAAAPQQHLALFLSAAAIIGAELQKINRIRSFMLTGPEGTAKNDRRTREENTFYGRKRRNVIHGQ